YTADQQQLYLTQLNNDKNNLLAIGLTIEKAFKINSDHTFQVKLNVNSNWNNKTQFINQAKQLAKINANTILLDFYYKDLNKLTLGFENNLSIYNRINKTSSSNYNSLFLSTGISASYSIIQNFIINSNLTSRLVN